MPRNRNVVYARIAAGAIVLILLSPSAAYAIKVSPPPARAYVAQVWVGFSVDDCCTLRLDLKTDGTGSGVFVEYEESRPFRITRWSLENYALALNVEFDDSERTNTRLVGKFKTYLLSYTVGMLPNPEKVYDRDIPGPLELTFEKSTIRFGLWPEAQLRERLERARPKN